MRETVKTLRLYFGVSAALAIFLGIRQLSLREFVAGMVGFTFGMAYLYLSVLLPSLLLNSLKTIMWILVASSVFVGIAFLSGLLLGHISIAVESSLGLALNWYLFQNAKRLATELHSPPVIPESRA